MLTSSGTCTDKMEGKCQARHFLHAELDCPAEEEYAGVIKFMVLRVETPVMFWVRMLDMKMSTMYQKMVLGMARHFAKAESRKQLEVLERGKLVAAAGSDGVYRRARLEEMVYKVRSQMQYIPHSGQVKPPCSMWLVSACLMVSTFVPFLSHLRHCHVL